VCFHCGTRAAADARIAQRNGDATLVETGYADYPFVVIERAACGSCVQTPEPLFVALIGESAGPNDRIATTPDGTTVVVRRNSDGVIPYALLNRAVK
jgi:hypothetical protein